MHEKCRQWIVGILQGRLSLVALAVRQRAKFEGWLKFELGFCAEREGAGPVRVEESSGKRGFSKRGFSDVCFRSGKTLYYVELKTSNTNYRVPGVVKKSRPITINIASIVKDAKKLRHCSGRGIVAFVLFPIRKGDSRWMRYLQRIGRKLNTTLSEKDHCTRVCVPIEDDKLCEVVVCCFPYPLTSDVKL